VRRQPQDAKAACRMLAIALVLEGWSGEACAMDHQTLRDWVHRYNEFGLEGLFALPRCTPVPDLRAEQQASSGMVLSNLHIQRDRISSLQNWNRNGPATDKCSSSSVCRASDFYGRQALLGLTLRTERSLRCPLFASRTGVSYTSLRRGSSTCLGAASGTIIGGLNICGRLRCSR
jgi:hypothetical protein